MKNPRILLAFFLAAMFAVPALVAQEDADAEKLKMYRKRDLEQAKAYEEGSSIFPAQPKSDWSVGVKGGLAFITGDVKGRNGAAFGLGVRKDLGHAFSLRFQGQFGRTYGLDYRKRFGWALASHPTNPWVVNGYTDPVFENYRMQWADFTLEGIINLNNINFYKEQAKWNIYAAGGIGMMGYSTRVNALDDGGGRYADDFAQINPDFNNPSFSNFREAKSSVWNTLDGILDDSYESFAEGHTDRQGITIGDEYYVVQPMVTAALGLQYRLSRRLEATVEYRIGITSDDLLDGVRWSERGDFTYDFDNLNQLTLGLNFRFGGGEDALWWKNPLTPAYSAAAEARNLVKRVSQDTDNDGVPDLYDKEPDTPEGAPVDPSGRTLDSDGDAVPDYMDDQPFSPKGALVDARGFAMDSDGDGVPDLFDKEPNSKPGALVDAKGISITTLSEERVTEIAKQYGGGGGGTGVDGRGGCMLPMIHFDLDRAEIKTDYYPELYYIAQVMRADPGLVLKAVGHTDVRSSDGYNEGLSRRRVENTVDFLVKTYGISRERFVTEFQGEKINIIPDLPDNRGNRSLEPLHYMNRRVEFECIK